MLKHQILLTGIGSYLPKNKTSNNDLAKLMDTSDEWITTRSGIQSRHIATNSKTSDLAYQAAKKAILNYSVIKHLDKYSLVEITLETGRHHQIRCQLSKEGMFIKGDVKYGAKRPNSNGSICLHARKISFKHPTKEEKICLEASVPKEDIWKNI